MAQLCTPYICAAKSVPQSNRSDDSSNARARAHAIWDSEALRRETRGWGLVDLMRSVMC